MEHLEELFACFPSTKLFAMFPKPDAYAIIVYRVENRENMSSNDLPV